MARRRIVHVGIPALFVLVLIAAALWRPGPAPPRATPASAVGVTAGDTASAATTATSTLYAADGPLTHVADLLVANSVGRTASLDGIEVRQRTSARTLWAAADGEQRIFVVLDAGVPRQDVERLLPGRRVTLIGTVHPSPAAAAAPPEWQVDAATAQSVTELGTYLLVTEVR